MNRAGRAVRHSARLAALRLAGPVLAAYNRLLDWIERSHPEPRAGRSPRILLIRPDHLGDVLLSTPTAAILRDALPGAEVDWLVGPGAAELAARCSGPGEVLTLDFPGFTRRPKRSAIEPYRLLLREAARLRKRQYDAALILRPDHWWGAMLAAAAGIPRRVGYAVAECRPFLTDAFPPSARHAVRLNQALTRQAASRLGGTLSSSASVVAPRFPVSADDAAWAEARERTTVPSSSPSPGEGGEGNTYARGSGEDTPLVAIHPGTGAAVKNWSPERWAAVAESLGDGQRARIVLTGGPGERALVESIAARLEPRPMTLVGETTIGQLAALFARCDLVIGGDSGPLHLAAAVGTPTVRLYGPTDVGEFGPWPPDAGHVTLVAGLACQPCRNLVAPPCGAVETPPCMQALTPEVVFTAARRQLERLTPRTVAPAQAAGADRS